MIILQFIQNFILKNNKMKVEVWYCESDDSTTVICDDDFENRKFLGDDAVLIRTIEGTDWNDCMRQHHKLMGWNPYIPMDED